MDKHRFAKIHTSATYNQSFVIGKHASCNDLQKLRSHAFKFVPDVKRDIESYSPKTKYQQFRKFVDVYSS